MNNGKNDLTEGSIGRKLISFFLPIAAGTLFQQLYNAADAIVVGKFVGTIALAAVGGSAAHITNLLIGFFVALSGGSTVVIAQLFGAKDEESIQKATGTAIAFCIISGIVLTIVGFAFTPVFLRVLQSPPDTIAESTTYLRIVFLGVTAQLLYNMEAGMLQAVGDSKSPFIYLFICCMFNIFLDLLLVAVFKMGVAGAAIATIASQIISAVLATAKLMRSKEAYRITLKGIGLHRKLLGRMLHIGIPAGLQSSMYAISNMIIQVAVNLLGTATVAAWSLSGKIDGFYWACSNAAGIAVMNFAAQNYGAGRMDRVHDCEKLSLKLFMGVTLLFSALLLGVGRFRAARIQRRCGGACQDLAGNALHGASLLHLDLHRNNFRRPPWYRRRGSPCDNNRRRRVPAEGGMDSDSIQVAPQHAQCMPRVSNILDSDGRSFLLLLPQGKVAVPH